MVAFDTKLPFFSLALHAVLVRFDLAVTRPLVSRYLSGQREAFGKAR